MLHWKYTDMLLNSFWFFVSGEYPEIVNKSLEAVLQFSLSCLHEIRFSALRNIKHKQGNTLTVLYMRQMWVCLSNIPLKFVTDTELKWFIMEN